jgi:hypothetical protein
MATLQEVPIPKKRITTYGKSVRRRVPEHHFGSLAPRTHTPERKQSEPLSSRTTSPAPAEPIRPKSIPRAPISRTPSSLSPKSRADIFDVPSSEDEPTPPVPRLPHKLPSKQIVKNKVQKVAANKEVVVAAAADLGSRKRVKLSPAPSLSHTTIPAKIPPKKAIQDSRSIAKQLPKVVGHGSTSTMVSRPKLVTAPRKAERARTPHIISSQPKTTISNKPSPESIDTDMMDLDSSAKYISPKGRKLWDDLLGSVDIEGMSMNGAVDWDGEKQLGEAKSRLPGRVLFKPAGITKSFRRSPKMLPRRRLIDTLVEQTPEEDLDEDGIPMEESHITLKPALEMDLTSNPTDSRNQSVAPDVLISPTVSGGQAPLISGPKFTYSRHRSMLAEEDLMSQFLDMPIESQAGRRPRRGSIPTLTPLQSFHEEEEEPESTQAIRSVHELRQAGANNRFNDEIEDFLDRIGKPSTSSTSMRRSGLIDLAQKLQDKNFLRQFRAGGVEQRLFLHLSQEADIIAGFFMASILMVVLVDTSMPHFVSHLRRHGITNLLVRLLESQVGIVALGRERKSNMSRMAQTILVGHQKALLDLPIWEKLEPQLLSPRTVALKCLELMVRQTRESGNSSDIISKELSTELFQIITTSSEDSSWELPQGEHAIDFYLALSTLESHSIAVRTAQDESIWINDYLPIVADTLLMGMTRKMEDFGRLQVLILRLTLNVTNNNTKASDVFAKEEIMAVLGGFIISRFKKILRFLLEEEFLLVLDHLLLALGTMANLANLSLTGRQCLQNLQGRDNDPLESMVQIFVDNAAKMAEVSFFNNDRYSLANCYRLIRWRKVKRMLLLAGSPSFSVISACFQNSQIELLASSQPNPYGHW